MKHILLVLSLILALFSNINAQECGLTLTGIISDEHDGRPLGYADVWLSKPELSTVSNAKGEFSFNNICQGSLTLHAAHLGCDTLVLKFNISSDSHLVLHMEHHTELLELVRIEAQKPHQDIASRTEIERHALERMQARNFSDALDGELGVQMSQTGGNIAKPMVHGLTGNRIAIINNGVLLKGQQWGTEHAPEIDPYSAEEIEVIYGASSLRYGPEALAGTIITNNTSDTLKQLHGWVHLHGASNGRGGNASVKLRGAPIKRLPLFVYAQATVGRMGDLAAPRYILDNTGSTDQHWQTGAEWIGKKSGIRFDYRQFNSRLGILSFAHIGNLTDLREVIDRGEPIGANEEFSYLIDRPFQQVAHEVGAASFWWRPRIETKVSLDVSRQFNRRQEFDNSAFSNEEADLQYELTTHQLQATVEHRFSKLLKSEFGTSAQRQANTYEGRFFIPNYLSVEGGAFFIQHFQWKNQEIEAGVRYDLRWQQAFMFRRALLYTPIRVFQGVSLNFGYAIDKRAFSFSTNVARGWRPPAINELYSNGLHHGAASVEIGDETLQEERLWSWLSQTDIRLFDQGPRKLIFMLRTHLSYYDQFIYLVPTGEPVLTIRGAFPTFAYQGVEAILGGFDASLRALFGPKIESTIGLELLRAQDLAAEEPLLFIPPDRLDVRVKYKINSSDEGRYIQIHAIGVREQDRFPIGIDYALPPPAFLLMGGELGWTLKLSAQSKIITALSITNALNQSYRSYTNRLRYFSDEIGRNVSLVVRIPINN